MKSFKIFRIFLLFLIPALIVAFSARIWVEVPEEEDQETALESGEITDRTEIPEGAGILIIRFLLDESKDNKLSKLPNFRIIGPKNFNLDNTPEKIHKDAIHLFLVPQGKYSIGSLYFFDREGNYTFDAPFPPNEMRVESKTINYMGDIRVRLVEETSGRVISRKLRLKLPADNAETLKKLEKRFAVLLSKYPLQRRIIKF